MELKDTREIDSYFTYDGSRAHKFSDNKFVTENGCVYSLRKGTAPVQIAMTPNKGGYLPLRYTNKDGTAVYTSVHQRVAQSFIDNHSNFEVVDHINENKGDNRAINLRWTTLKGNTDYYNFKDNREIEKLKALNRELRENLRKSKETELKIKADKEKLEKMYKLLVLKLDRLTSNALKSIDMYAKRNIPKDKFDSIVEATKGDVFDSVEDMVCKVSKEVKVNGVAYKSIREAAKFITEQPECTSTLDTIRKEIRKLVRGERGPWMYLKKFYISL